MVDMEDTNKQAESFLELLVGREGERHAVIMQDFPDPDAISCAFAYRLIASERGIDTDLIYGGRVSHQENIAMINLLNIEIFEWGQEPITSGKYDGAIFVDNQGTTVNLVDRLDAAGVPSLAVVDHHAKQDRLKPLFQDIRVVGACASIFADYISKGALELKSSKPEHRRLATALMHGIISETGSMISALPLDFTAAALLQPFIDNELLMEILHQQRSHRVMEIIRMALENRVIREGYCFSGIGYLRSSDRDAIPQAADFLLTEATVHTAVVYGMVTHAHGGESINGSLRTTEVALGPDSFLKDSLGKMENGTFYGGGKSTAGGFAIPLGFLSGQDDTELSHIKWKAFDEKIRKKFFNKIGVDEDKDEE
ncbi:MAG: bifunctional oligoribonuclease/PAP phosphatase NrnA [Magnetococcales bacterium]|nr:bifunctional oligoribonuclease/PAP phosphatase NrnA [Magnetococcales bacterium]